jgi:O-antigen/teichoic acid export membrane protein
VLAPTLLFFVALFKIKKVLHPVPFHSICFDWNILKNLSSYSLMALFSAILSPMVYVAIRNNIIINLSIESAGYWEGLTRIASYYFLFISSLISVYFLPKLSASNQYSELKKIIWSYFKNIIPIFIGGLVLVFFLRNHIIEVLYTSEFKPMESLFFWQLIGDLMKAISLIFGILFFVKKKTLAFIFFEVLSLSLMYFSTLYFISLIGIQGVVLAHAFTYAIYTIMLGIYFRKTWI